MIGIVGGVGPYAGLDLMRKVFDQTLAGGDQEHVDALLFSFPSGIADRTEYLEGRVEQNPGVALAEVLIRLEQAGATVSGIPCNTAHAVPIFGLILETLNVRGSRIRLLHMVDETAKAIDQMHPGLKRIGVLSTTGTYKNGIYQAALEGAGKEVIRPSREMQEKLIHPAIYDPVFGIKSLSNPIHFRAMENLQEGFRALKQKGAEAVVLGCTEISLAFPGQEAEGMTSIDPNIILARALIRETFPEKLKPI